MTLSQDEQLTPKRRWLITITVMAATLIQVLDTTIVNVALPHMQGSLNASPDQSTWILTSYLVASAIFMPMTGYFTDLLGRKKYLLISIIGFTVTSAFCGAATSIAAIVIFRLLQGVFGAGLVPLSQAILTDIFPANERGKAMAIWGSGVMVGPILGPTLGGYLTEVANWRWTFYINVPIGIMAAVMVWRFVPDTLKKFRPLNKLGLLFMVLTIGAAQYVLDRGNQQDWLSAVDIRVSVMLMVIGLAGFIHYGLRAKSNPVFPLQIFRDRNFILSSVLMIVLGVGMYGSMVIQPQMLESVLNYPVLTAGLVMAPRGIAGMVGMVIVSKLINKVDPRWLVIGGILLSVVGVGATTYYPQNVNIFWLTWPMLLQGFGLGMIFVPLTTVGFATLPAALRVEAAGLFSLVRTFGSAVGISVTTTFFTRHLQMAWNQVGGSIQPFNPALYDYLQSMHLTLQQPEAVLRLATELNNQAFMLSLVNTFAFTMWGFLVMLPVVLLLKRMPKNLSS